MVVSSRSGVGKSCCALIPVFFIEETECSIVGLGKIEVSVADQTISPGVPSSVIHRITPSTIIAGRPFRSCSTVWVILLESIGLASETINRCSRLHWYKSQICLKGQKRDISRLNCFCSLNDSVTRMVCSRHAGRHANYGRDIWSHKIMLICGSVDTRRWAEIELARLLVCGCDIQKGRCGATLHLNEV